jgi:predicted enzyme related to lactoylglutathione lyase
MKKVILIGLAVLFSTSFQNCTHPKQKSMENNKVTWFSIPADSLNRAAAFYNAAFNWRIEPLTMEENEDFSFHTIVNSESDENYVPNEKGAVNGCLVKRRIGLPTPAVLVEVADLDRAIEKVIDAGGEIMTEKITMKSLNAVLVLIKDPEGNYVEVFQPLTNMQKP